MYKALNLDIWINANPDNCFLNFSDIVDKKAISHQKKYENLLQDAETNSTKEDFQLKEKVTDKMKATDIKEYLCCPEIWKGLGLMFFYQFAGYNVVSFYASSILNNPKETEKELMHPNKTINPFVQIENDHIISDK